LLLGCGSLLLVLATLWATRSQDNLAPDRSLARIRESGVLLVGIDPTYPPFESTTDSGDLVGYDVDLAREVAHRLGVTVSFVAVDVGGIHDGLLAHKYDAIISSVPPYPELSKEISFSRPYYNAGQVLVVRSDANSIEGIQDIPSASIAIEVGSTADLEMRSLVEKFPNLTVRRLSSPDLALEEVRAGRADAAVVDTISAYEFVGRVGGVKVVGSPITVEPYVVSTRRVDIGLSREIDRIIGELQDDGTLGRLQKQWVEGSGK